VIKLFPGSRSYSWPVDQLEVMAPRRLPPYVIGGPDPEWTWR